MKTTFYQRMTALAVVMVTLAFTAYGQSAGGKGPDVLIVGMASIGQEMGAPGYWLNDRQQALPVTGALGGSARAIAVSGSNVYIAGSTQYPNSPCYWLNGTRHDLPVSRAEVLGGAAAIAVSGSNVYIAGSERSHTGNYQWKSTPGYWLNGVWHDLPVSGTYGSAAAIVISGSDVYIAGQDGDGEKSTPGYWLNGVWQGLPVTGTSGSARGIAVSGSGVYILGSDGDTFGYWLNGVWQALPLIGAQGSANGIAVSGSDVYIVGYDYDTSVEPEDFFGFPSAACYWLNGTRHALPVTGKYGNSARAIVVSGSNVYITGQNEYKACYWLNGTRHDLPHTGARGSADAIVLR
ncbi:MAG: hypothetical protein LBK74_10180 [Treponema sp.]|jgi:hypothetical protein|nr:hypothetical protein [Treponema sp.]